MHEERIKELDALLLAANENIVLLTKANEDLTVGLAEAERTNKKLRRGARQDGKPAQPDHGFAEPPPLTLLRRDYADLSGKLGVRRQINRPVLHDGAGRVLGEISPGADRSRGEAAAAIRADVAEEIHAWRAKGALVGTDARLGGGGRQGLVAVLAGRTQLQHGRH